MSMRLRFPARFAAAMSAYALLAFLSAPALRGDTVMFRNGDRLTGTAVKLEGGKLTFKTTYADAIAIAWDQVATLTTAEPPVLPTAKEALSVKKVERAETGMVATTASGPVTLDAAAVTILRSAADEKVYEASLRPDWAHAWLGTANASLALARGNSNTTTFGFGFTAARTTRNDKTALYANTLYSKNGNAVPSTSANATGGGFGWHPIKSPGQTFDLLGGLVWTCETYSPGPTNSFAAIDLGEQYTHKLGAASLFTEQMFVYPGTQTFHQVQFSIDSTFNTQLGKLFNWQTTFSNRFTNFPGPAAMRNDAILTTGLGVTLARP